MGAQFQLSRKKGDWECAGLGLVREKFLLVASRKKTNERVWLEGGRHMRRGGCIGRIKEGGEWSQKGLVNVGVTGAGSGGARKLDWKRIGVLLGKRGSTYMLGKILMGWCRKRGDGTTLAPEIREGISRRITGERGVKEKKAGMN